MVLYQLLRLLFLEGCLDNFPFLFKKRSVCDIFHKLINMKYALYPVAPRLYKLDFFTRFLYSASLSSLVSLGAFPSKSVNKSQQFPIVTHTQIKENDGFSRVVHGFSRIVL